MMLAMFFIMRNPVTLFNAYSASVLFMKCMAVSTILKNPSKKLDCFEVLLLGNLLLV